MTTPSRYNDYAGSAGEWLHKHDCVECRVTEPVEFRPGYAVSACGKVWGSGKTRGRAFRRMAETTWGGPYLWVQLHNPKKKVSVHRLVAKTFLAPKKPGDEVRHLDGDPTNNALSNIRWGSGRDNAADRDRHGKTARGEQNGFSRHTDAEVASALAMLSAGSTQRAVAAEFECSQATVWRWKHGQRRPS